MSVFVIGDLHLSLASDKPMDVFGGWKDYVQRLEANWRSLVAPSDTVVLAGDTSWGMSLEESLRDFEFLQALPGRKLLLKGNHDYWWNSAAKMNRFFLENGLSSLEILHNNCATAEGLVLCGTRGWLFENGQPFDQKIVSREAGRLEASLRCAEGLLGERVVFLHYPPVFGDQVLADFIDIMKRFDVSRCYYGHLHGPAGRAAVNGQCLGLELRLIAADFLGFCPVNIGKT